MLKKIILTIVCFISIFCLVSCTKTENVKISYYLDLDSPAVETVVVKDSAFPNDFLPSKAEYRFIGWTTDSAGNNDFNLTSTVSADLVLYAKWAKLYYITFDLNGQSGSITQIEAITGENVTLPNRDNLGGWSYLDTIYQPGSSFQMIAENITLTAVWGTMQTLNFDFNGGTTSLDQTYSYRSGTEITLPSSSEISKENYTLVSFSDGKNEYLAGAKYVMPQENVTLKANFSGAYQVKYQDGENETTLSVVTNDKIVLPESLTDGDIFLGWLVNGVYYQVGDEITVLYQDLVFEAVWTILTYNVTFLDWDNTIIDQQEVRVNNSATSPDSVITTIPEFNGWNKDFSNITSNLVVRATYQNSFGDIANYNFVEVDDYYEVYARDSVSFTGTLNLPATHNGKLVIGTLNNPSSRSSGAFYHQGVTIVNVPSTYQYLGKSSFEGIDTLTTVNFATNSIVSLGDYCFYNCKNFNNMVIPDSVEYLGERALFQSAFTEIKIGKSLTTIGPLGLFGCASLENIIVDSQNSYFASVEGVLYNKTITELLRYPTGKTNVSYTVPSTIQKIADYALNRAVNLTELIFESNNTLLEIGSFAFSESANILKIDLPSTVKTFGSNVFYACKADVNLTEGMTAITSGMFRNYIGETVTIPDSVEVFEEEAFAYSDVVNIIFGENSKLTTIGIKALYTCNRLETFPFESLKNLTTIGEDAFYQSKLKNITFNSTLQSFGYSAFACSRNLETVKFLANSKLASIGNSAFRECPALKSVIFEDNSTVTNVELVIGEYAFSDCISLITVVLPNTLTKIEGMAFGAWASEPMTISSITLPANLEELGLGVFDDCTSLEKVTFTGNSLKIIGNYCFRGCTSLETINIPSSVETIGTAAFLYCSSLTNINVSTENRFFKTEDCGLIEIATMTLIYGTVDSKGAAVISNGVLNIATSAYENNLRLISVTIPDSVKIIGALAFKMCYNLTTVNLNATSKLEEIGESAFSAEQGLDSGMKIAEINFPEGLKIINTFAFLGNDELKTITIPSTVTSISGYAFYNCPKITEVKFASNSELLEIRAFAFSRCTSLKKVTLTADATSLKNGVFSGDTALEEIIIEGNNVTLETNVFKDVANNFKIYVPATRLLHYKTAEYWNVYANKIFSIENISE